MAEAGASGAIAKQSSLFRLRQSGRGQRSPLGLELG